jgi:hypothetical protein
MIIWKRRLINDVVTEKPGNLQDSASDDEKFDSDSEMMEVKFKILLLKSKRTKTS